MNHRRKWLVLATNLGSGSPSGGIARYTQELIAGLRELATIDLNLLVTPSARRHLAQKFDLREDALHPLPGRSTACRSLLEIVGCTRAAGSQWDVAVGTKHILPGLRATKKVLVVHDTLLFDRPQDYGPAKSRFLPPIYRYSLRRSTHLACVSAATRDRLQSHMPHITARQAIIRPTLPVSLLHATPDSRGLSKTPTRPFALIVSDSSPRKNLDFVYGLWPDVRAAVPNAELYVVGAAQVDQASAGGAQDKHVSHLGRVTDSQLRWLYANAATVLAPSEAEGFGFPVAEAMHLARWVIASADPAHIELGVENGQYLPARERNPWISAIIDALRAWPPPIRHSSPIRTWANVARELVEFVDAGPTHRPDYRT